ncbi:ribonuclease HII [Basilea psittacipulmonis DSM 24701]|uniref:Ribonuclease HII n=1 Tax=Basilea psittacipulmonis DSM 24701 TaxID=1072685 RepID=A0A077DHM4_9BURK|nr:ribonuclease HII [Basilea psittacipulmonis DSM 24701]
MQPSIYIAGIDEAGRGPLAGDVFAAAVILDPQCEITGLNDSKKLSAAKREALAQRIKEKALAYAIAHVSPQVIDEINILQATLQAMREAFLQLPIPAQRALIDGNKIPENMPVPCEAVIKGDQKHPCIMAASILAKTARDEHIMQAHQQYPEYGFDQHKGYGTALHLENLKKYGPSPIHRFSFAPVKQSIKK